MSLRFFDPDSFLNDVTTAFEARKVAETSDRVLCQASFALYGNYVNGDYVGLSSYQKPGDEIVLLGYKPKAIKRGKNE